MAGVIAIFVASLSIYFFSKISHQSENFAMCPSTQTRMKKYCDFLPPSGYVAEKSQYFSIRLRLNFSMRMSSLGRMGRKTPHFTVPKGDTSINNRKCSEYSYFSYHLGGNQANDHQKSLYSGHGFKSQLLLSFATFTTHKTGDILRFKRLNWVFFRCCLLFLVAQRCRVPFDTHALVWLIVAAELTLAPPQG